MEYLKGIVAIPLIGQSSDKMSKGSESSPGAVDLLPSVSRAFHFIFIIENVKHILIK